MSTTMPAAIGIKPWWREEKNKAHSAVFAWLKNALQNSEERRREMMYCLRLYGGQETIAGIPGGQSHFLLTDKGQLLSLNVIKSIVDTVSARRVRQRPKPYVVSNDGTQEQQDRAQGCTDWISGVYYQTDAYDTAEECELDSDIMGVGFSKVYDDDGELKIDRVYSWEVIIDDVDGYHGQPLCMAQIQPMAREAAVEKYAVDEYGDEDEELAAAIRAAEAPDPHYVVGAPPEADMVLVVEIWRLGMGRDHSGKPRAGRRILCVSGKTLADEPYRAKFYPIVEWRWQRRRVGFWGEGLVEQLQGLQIEINGLLEKLQDAHKKIGKAWLFVKVGTKVDQQSLTNANATKVEYTGDTPPRFDAIQVVPVETYQYLWSLVEHAYQISGVSQMAAQSQLPAGLRSGKAIRSAHEVEELRFPRQHKLYERGHQQLANVILQVSHEMAEARGEKAFTVRYVSEETAKEIRWGEVQVPDPIVQIMSASLLPSTFAGRLEAVQDLLDLGAIDRQEARMYLDRGADLRARPDLFESTYVYTMKQLEALRSQKPDAIPLWCKTPENFQDQFLCKRLGIATYFKARQRNDVPEENLNLLRRYILTATNNIRALAPPSPGPAPVDQATPAPAAADAAAAAA